MIDWARVAELRGEIGEEGFAEVVEIFLEESGEAAAALGAAPEEELEGAMHFLKGSALNLGMARLAAACQAGERAAGAGRGDEVDRGALLALYEASRAAFLAGVNEPAARAAA